MGLIDGITVLLVIMGFGYIILVQIKKKNPQALEKAKEFFTYKIFDKTPIKNSNDPDTIKEQIWRQKIDRI